MEGAFLCRWGANSPLPQPKAALGPKHELMWPECHLFYWRKIYTEERRQPRWKASSCPTPIPLSVPLQPLLSSFLALLVTLPFTMHSISNLKCRCFLPLGQDTLPLCLLSSSWQASQGQKN